MKTSLKKATDIFDVIRIAERTSDLEEDRVFVSVNGDAFRCQRDVPIPLPRAHVEVLRSAKRPRYKEEDRSGDLTKVVQAGWAQRFPFEVLYPNIPKGVYEKLRKISRERDAPLTDDEIEALVKENLAFQEQMSAGKQKTQAAEGGA